MSAHRNRRQLLGRARTATFGVAAAAVVAAGSLYAAVAHGDHSPAGTGTSTNPATSPTTTSTSTSTSTSTGSTTVSTAPTSPTAGGSNGS